MVSPSAPPPDTSPEFGEAVGPIILGVFVSLLGIGSIMIMARNPEKAWPEYFAHRSMEARREARTRLLKRSMAEFIGTFFVAATIEIVSGGVPNPLAAFAIGSVVMAMTFSLCHVSGAHFNPAITFAVWLRGMIEPIPAVSYVLVQIVAAFAGGGVHTLTPGSSCTETNTCGAGFPFKNPDVDYGFAFLIEFLFSVMIVTVVLNTVTSRAQENNMFFGLAVGVSVLAGAAVGTGISGGSFNPAIGTALDAIHGNTRSIWLYWVAPCCGAVVGAILFRFGTSWHDEFTPKDRVG